MNERPHPLLSALEHIEKIGLGGPGGSGPRARCAGHRPEGQAPQPRPAFHGEPRSAVPVQLAGWRRSRRRRRQCRRSIPRSTSAKSARRSTRRLPTRPWPASACQPCSRHGWGRSSAGRTGMPTRRLPAPKPWRRARCTSTATSPGSVSARPGPRAAGSRAGAVLPEHPPRRLRRRLRATQLDAAAVAVVAGGARQPRRRSRAISRWPSVNALATMAIAPTSSVSGRASAMSGSRNSGS